MLPALCTHPLTVARVVVLKSRSKHIIPLVTTPRWIPCPQALHLHPALPLALPSLVTTYLSSANSLQRLDHCSPSLSALLSASSAAVRAPCHPPLLCLPWDTTHSSASSPGASSALEPVLTAPLSSSHHQATDAFLLSTPLPPPLGVSPHTYWSVSVPPSRVTSDFPDLSSTWHRG